MKHEGSGTNGRGIKEKNLRCEDLAEGLDCQVQSQGAWVDPIKRKAEFIAKHGRRVEGNRHLGEGASYLAGRLFN